MGAMSGTVHACATGSAVTQAPWLYISGRASARLPVTHLQWLGISALADPGLTGKRWSRGR